MSISLVKYVKAKDVFPKFLLDEIQRYVQGEMVYIPKSPENYEKWGTNTTTKKEITIRNENIVKKFKTGISILRLSEFYSLSEDTIKKIVYGK